MTTAAFPKAFGVRFKQLSRFDPASFQRIVWHWPTEVMAPIGSVLLERKEKVDRKQIDFANLQPITIHFDGSIDRRAVSGNRAYTMDLFFAHPGDVVVAKIDLKNGAVGIVPDWPNVVVTGHFAVYEPDRTKLIPEYLMLVIQARFFKDHLWRNKVGAEGRKEVKLDFFEATKIPLPPLDMQRAIVARWQQAQTDEAASEDRIQQLDASLDAQFYLDLGLQTPAQVTRPKAFAVWWKDTSKWGVRFVTDAMLGLDRLPPCAFPFTSLGSVAKVTYGIQKSPTNRPGKHARPYLRVANVRKGYLDLSEIKTINVPDDEMSTFRLESGDILFVEGNGSRAELGRVAMWQGEIANCVHQNHLIKVRLDQTQMSSEFAMTWFNTEIGRGHFFRSAKTSSGLGTINSDEVRNAPIPLPPLDVQQDIMRRVAARRAEIARERAAAQHRAAEAAAEIEALILGTKTIDFNRWLVMEVHSAEI